jgi:hypothetical protein
MNSCNRVLVIIIFAFLFAQEKNAHAQQTHHVNVLINQGPTCQIVGVHDETPFEFELFPNPVKDQLTIISSEHNVCVSVLDLFGRIVLAETKLLENKIQLDVRDFANGIYYVRLKSERKTEYTKIIIHE